MGYYNDVRIVLYASNYVADADKVEWPSLKVWFDQNYPLREMQEWGGEVSYDPDTSTVSVFYHEVRWDTSHTDAINLCLLKFVDTFAEDAVAWEMIRLGENTDDIEMHTGGHAEHRLWVRREIMSD
jgi:hypothetical protein